MKWFRNWWRYRFVPVEVWVVWLWNRSAQWPMTQQDIDWFNSHVWPLGFSVLSRRRVKP